MKKEVKVLVDACPFCRTDAYIVRVSKEEAERLPHWIECTSGYGLSGGGACCAPTNVRVVPDDFTLPPPPEAEAEAEAEE